MPAAPSLELLFDTQSIFETALSAYLAANGLATYTSRSADNMPDSHVECQFAPGGATSHQATRTTSQTGWPEQDTFSGVITFRVQTERAIASAAPVTGFASVHDYRVALLKKLMLRGAINGAITGITALAIPYHRISVQGFAGQTPTVEDDAFDITELGWTIESQILSDAWPAAV
jgi:hypothetical protein